MNYLHVLKFTSKTKANSVLTDEIRSKSETIVEIGTIVKDAVLDEEGKEITPEQVVEGWHVDVLSKEIIDELREYCLDHLPNHCSHGNDFGDSIDEHCNIIKATVVLKEGEVQL